MGPYKPLRTWVEFPIPYCMELSWELIDPIAQMRSVEIRGEIPPKFHRRPRAHPHQHRYVKRPEECCWHAPCQLRKVGEGPKWKHMGVSKNNGTPKSSICS